MFCSCILCKYCYQLTGVWPNLSNQRSRNASKQSIAQFEIQIYALFPGLTARRWLWRTMRLYWFGLILGKSLVHKQFEVRIYISEWHQFGWHHFIFCCRVITNNARPPCRADWTELNGRSLLAKLTFSLFAAVVWGAQPHALTPHFCTLNYAPEAKHANGATGVELEKIDICTKRNVNEPSRK